MVCNYCEKELRKLGKTDKGEFLYVCDNCRTYYTSHYNDSNRLDVGPSCKICLCSTCKFLLDCPIEFMSLHDCSTKCKGNNSKVKKCLAFKDGRG